MPAKNFMFVSGQDDFLVDRLGRERFAVLAAETADEFSREIISGFAANTDDIENAIRRLREAVQTMPMFGGKHAVWLKDVNFLGDTQTGRAETTLGLVEELQGILEAVNPADTAVLVTAAPVDRRRSFFKWCEKNSDFALVAGGAGSDDPEAFAAVALGEARSLGAVFGPGAVELLVARVGASTRLLAEEVRKLANYASQPSDRSAEASANPEAQGAKESPITIQESDVAELTPNTAEGDFFEMAEAFFSGDLPWTLAALQRHFFTGGDARPLIAALQNRNRILLQVRALIDAGDVRTGPRGVDGLARAATAYAGKYGAAAAEKSSFNVFTQNPWYLGKLVGSAKMPTLRRLIDNQSELITAFEAIIRRPREQEDVLREMAVRCLAK
jgi:DNA polymerase-3 subunit delta